MPGMLDAQGNVRPMKIPSNAFPDRGFRHEGRPDQLIYGGAI